MCTYNNTMFQKSRKPIEKTETFKKQESISSMYNSYKEKYIYYNIKWDTRDTTKVVNN